MVGQMLSFQGNGEAHSGYLSRSVDGKGPGVIVLQEWWGLVGHITNVVDRFAAEGFTALAPDLYGGTSTTDPDEAGSLMMALNIEKTEVVLRGAVDALLADEACSSDQVGVVGFCMGGQLALFAASVNPKIGACVDFYGIHPNVHPPLDRLGAPVLGIFAEFDEYASKSAVHELDAHLNNLSKEHEFYTYPNAQHAFFNDDRPEVYDKQAAEDAWQRTVTFLHRHLKHREWSA